MRSSTRSNGLRLPRYPLAFRQELGDPDKRRRMGVILRAAEFSRDAAAVYYKAESLSHLAEGDRRGWAPSLLVGRRSN